METSIRDSQAEKRPRSLHASEINLKEFADEEHQMTISQAIRTYPKTAAWSMTLSMALVMEGFDAKLLNSLFAVPKFVERYGTLVEGSYSISAAWQAGLTNGSSVGQLMGLLVSGYLAERIGFRKTMMTGLSMSIAFIFIQFFAPSLIVLQVAQVLMGITLGMNQMIPLVYAKELAPLPLHAFLTTFVNMGWIFGNGVSLGVMRGVLSFENSWQYKIPFAVQWIFPVILIPCVFFAPESPWLLVRCGRYDDAKAVVLRVQSVRDEVKADGQIAMMIATTDHEREVNAHTSYLACFKGPHLRRTIIVIWCYCIQTFSGNSLRGYSTYFLEKAGLEASLAFDMSLATFGMSAVGTALSWFISPFVGRRSTYIYGLAGLFVIWIAVGGLGVPQRQTGKAEYAWGIGGLLIASAFLYDFTIGPVAYTLVSEIPASLVRSKSAASARWVYASLNIIFNIITPYQLGVTAWNWAGITGFWWAGFTLIGLVYTFFFIPETKDRTTVELDLLFERGISARHFATTRVDVNDALTGSSAKKQEA